MDGWWRRWVAIESGAQHRCYSSIEREHFNFVVSLTYKRPRYNCSTTEIAESNIKAGDESKRQEYKKGKCRR